MAWGARNLISTQVRGVEGGVDSIMGLSTTTLAAQLRDIVAARATLPKRRWSERRELGA